MVDFCLSLPMAERVLQRTELMKRMMRRVGVASITAARHEQGAGIYEARSRCIACMVEPACRAWLAGSERQPPSFCPNLDFLSLCMLDKPAAGQSDDAAARETRCKKN
ncbi:MAG: hypothetical protein EKK41_09940 [Hyphomicrobiales bacterium]|nr:MAG: hypothetical protein EKK41_09940 [Hyphomicrobiales bacterium]